MRFRDRPLLVDGIDAGLYLERPRTEEALLRPLLEGRNVLLLGEAGSGKSTMLRYIASRLEASDQAAVLVNAAVAADAADFLATVDAALEQRVGIDGRPDVDLSTAGSARLLAGARRLKRTRSVVILIDGLMDFDIGFDFFGRLRDELWGLGHVWALAARARDSGVLRTPPAGAFWGSVVELPPLNSRETAELLRLGLDDSEFARVGRSRGIAGEYPRELIRAAQAVLTADPTEPIILETGQMLVERATLLGRQEAMAMAELQGLGRPVSAHDEELLERLGWSRPYAQRILSHLEDAGLLRTIPERSDRPGRPRKLYEPNPHATVT